jgi:hypothetical protein
MAFLNELANQYLKQLRESTDKKSEVQKIVKSINDLIYSESKAPLSKEDKIKIVDLIRKSLSEGIIEKAGDNAEYLNLIDQILEDIGGK